MVRAKFTLQRVESSLYHFYEKNEDGSNRAVPTEMRTLVFSPVSANNDPKHENSKFWRYSPSGEVKLGTVNPEAWQRFELGKSYYLDFSEAPEG